jgi:hypothetical protein
LGIQAWFRMLCEEGMYFGSFSVDFLIIWLIWS